MKTCDKCGGSGMVYTQADVDQLVVMLLYAAALNPPVLPPWESDE